jgi:hypothetical protein
MLKKYVLKGMIIVLIFFFLIGGEVFSIQRSHFLSAEKYYSVANWKLAIREYDAAMHFYTPWSPYIEKSAERLWHIGEMLEKQDSPDWAVTAYSSIRSSFFASRSLYTPGTDWIRLCSGKIADLDVKMLIKEGSLKPDEAAAEKKRLLYVMTTDRAPAPQWSLLAEAGFLGWLSSVFFIIISGFNEDGKIRPKIVLYGIPAFIITFAVWVISLLKA